MKGEVNWRMKESSTRLQKPTTESRWATMIAMSLKQEEGFFLPRRSSMKIGQ